MLCVSGGRRGPSCLPLPKLPLIVAWAALLRSPRGSNPRQHCLCCTCYAVHALPCCPAHPHSPYHALLPQAAELHAQLAAAAEERGALQQRVDGLQAEVRLHLLPPLQRQQQWEG
jgi:hypothetical protein